MSTANPLPIQAVVSNAVGKASGVTSDTSSGSDFKGVFGGLLSNKLGTTVDTTKLTDGFSHFVIGAKGLELDLPSNGNNLPEGIAELLEGDIATLDAAVEGTPSFQLQLPVNLQSEGFGITLPSKLQTAADGLRPSDVLRTFVTSEQAALSTKPAEGKVTTPVVGLADANLDTETLSFTQLKQTHQLQNLLSPVVRQAEVNIEAGQISRVVEQFSELTQRVAPAATASTTTAAIGAVAPLSESSLASSSSGVAQLSVDVPVQDERWQKAFSQRVVWSVGNNQSAQLRVHPAELGRIDIQVNVENDKASVVFNAQHSSVKDAIELAVPRLREMLAEQGVDLVDVNVSQEDVNQQQAGTGDNSTEQNESDTGLQASAGEDGSSKEWVSHLAVDDDAIDYYV